MSEREILFRGKRTDNGEWVEGYYVLYPDGKAEILKRCDDPPDNDPMWHKVMISYKVDPETVCRYTGLTDKNGRKIFEGDVLEFTNSEFGKSNYIVFWNQIEWGIRSDLGNDDDLRFWDSSEWEVIGNIFDNPELIP